VPDRPVRSRQRVIQPPPMATKILCVPAFIPVEKLCASADLRSTETRPALPSRNTEGHMVIRDKGADVPSGAMPEMSVWIRLIIIVSLVGLGVPMVRNVTDALGYAVHGGAPMVRAAR